MGAATCSGLKKAYNNDVACQGVGKTTGKGYPAGLAENFVPKAMPAGYSSHIGTLQSAVDEAKKMFETAFTKCPQSIVVAGGYRQVFSSARSVEWYANVCMNKAKELLL